MLVQKSSEKKNIDPNKRMLVLDVGSWVKAGYAGDMKPTAFTPSVVANYPEDNSFHKRGPFVGEAAITESSRSPSLQFSFPVECGLPIVMEHTELLFEHVLQDCLRINKENQDIIITKKSLFPKTFQTKFGESMFEKFKCNRISFLNSDLMSLYCTGRLTGIIIDMGSSQCMIVPIVCGIPQYHAINRLELGGRDITKQLEETIEKNTEGEHRFRSAAEIDVVRKIKEQTCTVVESWKNETAIKEVYENNEQCFELPDGQRLTLGFERVQAPEILFQPTMAGLDDKNGLALKIKQSIDECDILERRELYKNIVLIGGTSMLTGLRERLKYELKQILPTSIKIKIIMDENRAILPWLSCSIFGSLQKNHESDKVDNSDNWITSEQYEEYGNSVFNRL